MKYSVTVAQSPAGDDTSVGVEGVTNPSLNLTIIADSIPEATKMAQDYLRSETVEDCTWRVTSVTEAIWQ